MNNCLHCNKPLTHVEGRKKKSFCGANCRNKYFYQKSKNKRLGKMPTGDLAVEIKLQPTSAENIKKLDDAFKKEGAVEAPNHPLWKEGDPKEGSMAFYLKYDCYTYSELEKKSK